MQQQNVLAGEMAQDFVDERFGEHLIGTAEEQNAVLGIFVDLNDGMAVGGIHLADEISMHTVLFAGIQEGLAAVADQTAVIDFHSGLGQCHGLVDALAAQEHIAGAGGFGFAGENDVVHAVNIVQIQRTDIQNSH